VELTGFDLVENGPQRRIKTISMPRFSLEGGLAGKMWTIDAAELSRLGGENAPLGCAQAKSDKEMGELRAQFAQEQTNQAREQAMAELREAQKREIAALRGEFMEQLSDLREQLAIVKEAQERAKSEETAGLRGQQERFAQLGSAQLAQAQREVEKIWVHL
jgi:hypothetical protein